MEAISLSVAAVVEARLPRIDSNLSLHDVFLHFGYGFETNLRSRTGTKGEFGDLVTMVADQFAFLSSKWQWVIFHGFHGQGKT